MAAKSLSIAAGHAFASLVLLAAGAAQSLFEEL